MGPSLCTSIHSPLLIEYLFPPPNYGAFSEILTPYSFSPPPPPLPQDPAGIFELVEVVGNGTYGQVYKVRL